MIRVYVLEVGELRRQMENNIPVLSGWDKLTDWQREKVSRHTAPGAGALCMGGQLLLQYAAWEWSVSPERKQDFARQVVPAGRAAEEESTGPAIRGTGITWQKAELSRICRTIPAPQPLQAACEARGKPYIRHVPWHYNLSHSGDYAALAVSDVPVGIDIQQMRPYRDSGRAHGRSMPLSGSDAAGVGRNMAAGQLFRDGESLFYTLWCRKEAYGKLLGTGLTEKVLKCNMLGDMDVRLYENGELPGYRICVCSGYDPSGIRGCEHGGGIGCERFAKEQVRCGENLRHRPCSHLLSGGHHLSHCGATEGRREGHGTCHSKSFFAGTFF